MGADGQGLRVAITRLPGEDWLQRRLGRVLRVQHAAPPGRNPRRAAGGAHVHGRRAQRVLIDPKNTVRATLTGPARSQTSALVRASNWA